MGDDEGTGPKRRRLVEEEEEDEDTGPDLISRLPDDVLGAVVTLLPAADGARTQALSRRWRPLWRAAPLNLEARVAGSRDESRAAAALAAHPGPARRLALAWDAACYYSDGFPAIDGWLRSPTLDGLRELELHYRAPDARFVRSYRDAERGGTTSPPPLPVLRFAPTLRLLSVSCDWCRLDIPAAGGAGLGLLFPHLEQMTLKGVSIAEATLHAVLAGCPALRSLALHYNIGYRRLRIRSATLRSLSVTDGHRDREGRFEEVVVEHAPLLERLVPDGLMYDLKIRVIQAPKLKVLGHLYSRDGINTRVFKGIEPVSLSNAMRTVKILALVTGSDLGVAIDLLQCFPCVEKLYIVAFSGRWARFSTAQRDVLPLECLDAHLKALQVTHYRGKPSEVELVRFFRSNARVLESIRLVVCVASCYHKWVATEHKKLRLDTGSPSSQGARIVFENDRWASERGVPVKHIHDLELDDLFDRSVRE